MKKTLAILILIAAMSGVASACPVCGGAQKNKPSDSSQWATVGATGGLIILPISMVAGLAMWLRKQ